VFPKINRPILVFIIIVTAIGLTAYTLSNTQVINHNISVKGIINPAYEWTLARNPDGNLLMSLKNNINNTISNYSITEFQRGDLAEFTLNEIVFNNEFVNKGDTIGIIYSNAEQRRLIELHGELSIQQRLLNFYASGEKPEEVQAAYERMMLALQEYETQKKITERNRSLYESDVIAEEEYDISLNQYQVKLQNYNISKSQYEAVLAGSKPEQLDYIAARINAIKEQINHLEQLLSSFNITTPISGKIIKQQGKALEYDVILKVMDTTQFILIAPVDVYQLNYITKGQEIVLSNPSFRSPIISSIHDFDNSIYLLNQRQRVFVNALIEDSSGQVFPNMQVEVKIRSGRITLFEYFRRLYNEIYNN
jgi:multidrug efflux pump subunit AcrA (membrane-fusion protein)